MQTELDMAAEFDRSDALAAKRAAANKLTRDTQTINAALHAFGNYHDYIPLEAISIELEDAGFDRLESMVLCGREGRLHENVGRNRWLSLTWHKMESGRYEVVAYVS